MTGTHAGVIHLTNGDDPVTIREFKDYTIESNGWLTVEKDGDAFHYPPSRVDHVEMTGNASA